MGLYQALIVVVCWRGLSIGLPPPLYPGVLRRCAYESTTAFPLRIPCRTIWRRPSA